MQRTIMTRVYRFLQDEAKTLGKDDLPPKRDWKIRYKAAPEQLDGVSCGVFVLAMAEDITFGREFSFTQADIPYLRRKIMFEMVDVALLQ